MLSDGGNDQNSPEKKGFSGLASLVSDVDSMVPESSDDARDTASNVMSKERAAASESAGTTLPSKKIDSEANTEHLGQSENKPQTATVASHVGRSDRSGSPQVVPWIVAFVAIAIALFAIFNRNNESVPTSSMSSSSLAPSDDRNHSVVPKPPPVDEPIHTAQRSLYAVAAINANLRALPTTRSKVVGSLRRGSAVEAIEQRDGFVKLKIGDNLYGWISSDILIEMAHLARLQSSSPADYIAAREYLKPIDKLSQYIDRVSPQVRALLTQIEGQRESVTAIAKIESYQRPIIEVDDAAGLWFSLAARAAANAGDHLGAIRLATAAIYADPLKVDYHTAVGFSAIASGQREIISFISTTLPALAPGATNTWVVVGVNAALHGRRELAHGALLAALERSRNRATTVRALRGIAAQSESPAVVAAVNEVLVAIGEPAVGTDR